MIKTNIVGQSFVSTTEMVKCYTNCFLATKASLSNEIKQICEKNNVDYDKIVEYGLYDKRLGSSHYGIYRSHLSAPGPAGKFGFGGSCFPKDSNAMIKYAENLEACPGRVWEVLEGGAISKEGEINE